MTSLIKQARVISYEVIFLSILENDSFRTLERIGSNPPYCTTLVKVGWKDSWSND